MNRKLIRNLSLISLALTVFTVTGAELSGPAIPECKTPPRIDGKLSDPCWESAGKINEFTIYRRGPIGSKTKDTQVLLTRDNKFLYIGLICQNSNMQHVDQVGVEHDDGANYKDDSVEILLGRKDLGHFYCYILTCGNMQGESRIARHSAIGWNMPWASATKRSDKGWTAEIALPLFIVNSPEPAPLELNFLRNKIQVTLDQMGAKQSEKKVMSCWKSLKPEGGRSCWPPFGLCPMRSTRDLKAQPVFLPRTQDVDFKGYKPDSSGKLSQVYQVNLRNYTGVPGTAFLKVIAEKKQKPLFEASQRINGNASANLSLKIPAASGQGQLSLTVTGDGGMPFQNVLLKSDASLIGDAFAELNYYTSETEIKLKVNFNLSAAMLKKCKLLIENPDGKTIVKLTAPKPESMLTIPAKKVEKGRGQWCVILKAENGSTYDTRPFSIVKLPPKPGREIKIDRFRRIVLVDGKPFFMYGMIYRPWLYGMLESNEPERVCKLYADIGFNTFINSYHSKTLDDTKWLSRIMDATRKNNLMVIDRFCGHRMALGKSKAYYNKHVKPLFMQDARVVSKYDNLLGYWNVDEPNLHDWRKNLEICEWYYKDMKQFDPYRAIFALFARNIPPVDAGTRWFDVFGYDVYTYPGWNRLSSDVVNAMAIETYELEKRLKNLHKPIYMMPMPTALDLRRAPLGLNLQEQLAQCYTALIYGAKGLLYFANLYSWGQETHIAFRRLTNDLKKLQPALLSLPVKYKITYKGKEVNIAKKKFPLVHARLFRYPDGRYLMLAVNSKKCPVITQFKIEGLSKVSRMFGNKKEINIGNNTFSDRLEALAVRAYKLDLKPVKSSMPIQIMITEKEQRVKIKPTKSEPILSALYRVSKRKNLMMNPSFEWGQRLPGVPDYYHPRVTAYPEKIGSSKHPFWVLESKEPYHGKYCMKVSKPAKGFEWAANELLGRYSCEKFPKKQTIYTLSVYLKGSKNGDKAVVSSVFAPRKDGKCNREVASRTFTLTTKWRRYSLPVKLWDPGTQPSAIPLTYGVIKVSPLPGSTVWADAIQLEKGNKATEFSGK